MKTHVAYDTRSGNIISIHHGKVDAAHARQRAHDLGKVEKQHIEVIAVPAEFMAPRKSYKVDVERKTLVEAAAGEHGISFSFGSTTES